MPVWGRYLLGGLVALVVVGGPAAHYRSTYTTLKRFRVVTDGKFYRSGQLTAGGFRDVITRYGIKTVINLQEENVDPFMPEVWLGKPSVRESDLCQEYGVKYYALFGGEIVPPDQVAAGKRPEVIDQYLKILDDPANYPVLLHCKAGLHRTGLMTAVYRREYEQWDKGRAMDELRANGFGTYMASTGNVYVVQFVDNVTPGERRPVTPAVPGKPTVANAGGR
ncbi:hypothetical protein BH11PLA2_BH11PLA2_26560 [soil metagenome]